TIVRNGGAIRVLMEEGEGEPVAKGDSAVFNYSGYIFSGSPSGMFAQGSYTALLGKGDLVPGLDAGIEGMKKGEQSLIFFSARYGFYNDAVSVVPKMSALVYNITLNDIIVKK
ncbi:MAG: FKBP-type peptidyl-prolyl cis-trans isomerase, partial [Bacteroidales bacterium]|nr:FKBP-type peptidyl-prolyl cis-trans isomerase [Bacteroidales bacterium]